MNHWLQITDIPDSENVPFDIVEHREELFRKAVGDSLWDWLGEIIERDRQTA